MKHTKIAAASVLALGALFSSSAFADIPPPSSNDTVDSMEVNAASVSAIFNLQTLKSAQSLSNDCAFGESGQACVSLLLAGADSRQLDATSGGLVLGFKSNNGFRFGAYIEQARESQDLVGGVTLKKGDPGYGVFAVWSNGEEGSALHVRAAAHMGNVFVETTRDGGDFAEDGFGVSDIKTTSAQLELIKDYALNDQWTISPYVGFRETQNKRVAYTELSNSADFPLTYSELKQNIQTVSAGATLTLNVLSSTQFALSAGVEEDVKNSINAYAGSHPQNLDASLDLASEKRKIKTVAFSFKQGISSSETIGFSVIQRKVKWAPEAVLSGSIQYSKSF